VWEQGCRDAEIEKLLTEGVILGVRDRILSLESEAESAPEPESLERAKVSYLNRFIRRDEPLKDARDRTLSLRLRGDRGILLVVDPEPDANWGHTCWIATCDFWSQDNRDMIRVVSNSFPPREDATSRLRAYGVLKNLLADPARS
jgi:hypothetical protein